MAAVLQVAPPSKPYGARMGLSLVQAIGEAARDARKRAGLKQIWVAVTLNMDPSTVARFEQGNWPRDLEGMLLAYQEVTGEPATEILADGVSRWKPDPPNHAEGFQRPFRPERPPSSPPTNGEPDPTENPQDDDSP